MRFSGDAPSARDECDRLKRYVEALKQAHRRELDGLLAQLRRQARQIAELRMAARRGGTEGAMVSILGAEQGNAPAISNSSSHAFLSVEDILPLVPPRLRPPNNCGSQEKD
jgi:DNA topoisomerase IB